MTRLTLAIDRLAALLLGAALLVAGVALAGWGSGRVARLDVDVDLTAVTSTLERPWWPWAVGVGGGALALLGVRWLLAHARRRLVGRRAVTLPGSGAEGRLSAQVHAVADAAAEVLEASPVVRSAGAGFVRERGGLVLVLDLAVEPHADLDEVARLCAEVGASAQAMLGRDDVQHRVRLRLATRARPLARVR